MKKKTAQIDSGHFSPTFEIRSEEFHEVLGTTSSWILRWGIPVVFLVVTTVIAGSELFSYQESVSVNVKWNTFPPPASVVTKCRGYIDSLYVNDGQYINKGDYLAVISDAAAINDIIYLKHYLSRVTENIPDNFALPKRDLQLGSLRSSFLSFYKALFDYYNNRQQSYYRKKRDFILRRLSIAENYRKSVLKSNPSDIMLSSFSPDKNKNSMSVEAEMPLAADLNEHTPDADLLVLNLREALLDVNNLYDEHCENSRLNLIKSVSQLAAELSNWERNFVLIAPISGIVRLNNECKVYNSISTGRILFNIIPSDTQKLIGKAVIPASSAARVKVGQIVNIDSEESDQNGNKIIKGYISALSFPHQKGHDNNKSFIADITIIRKTKNSPYGIRDILLLNPGNAVVITSDVSFLGQLISPLIQIFKR